MEKDSTFRARKVHTLHRETLHKRKKATLGSGNLHEAVVCPPGEDLNEWFAMNCVDFFNEISMLYGTIAPYCTTESCPVMSAGRKYEYLWADGQQVKRPIKVPAPQYMDLLLAWIDDQLSDERIFPTKAETPFPPDFHARVKNILKRLFRVYAHIYHSHFKKIIALGAELHLNSCFKHFMFFVAEFALIDGREVAPLRDLVRNLIGTTQFAKLGPDAAASDTDGAHGADDRRSSVVSAATHSETPPAAGAGSGSIAGGHMDNSALSPVLSADLPPAAPPARQPVAAALPAVSATSPAGQGSAKQGGEEVRASEATAGPHPQRAASAAAPAAPAGPQASSSGGGGCCSVM